MRRQLGYLAVAVLAIGIAVWLLVDGDDEGQAPIAGGPLVGVYRIAGARAGPPGALSDRPELVGRAFIVRRDGPELVAGLCPDEVVCRRWLDHAAFRHALPSLPATVELAEADPQTVLASAQVVGQETATTITTADGLCRRRIDGGTLDPTDVGATLRRELAQTELVADCEAQPAVDRIVIELGLVRLDVQ